MCPFSFHIYSRSNVSTRHPCILSVGPVSTGTLLVQNTKGVWPGPEPSLILVFLLTHLQIGFCHNGLFPPSSRPVHRLFPPPGKFLFLISLLLFHITQFSDQLWPLERWFLWPSYGKEPYSSPSHFAFYHLVYFLSFFTNFYWKFSCLFICLFYIHHSPSIIP